MSIREKVFATLLDEISEKTNDFMSRIRKNAILKEPFRGMLQERLRSQLQNPRDDGSSKAFFSTKPFHAFVYLWDQENGKSKDFEWVIEAIHERFDELVLDRDVFQHWFNLAENHQNTEEAKRLMNGLFSKIDHSQHAFKHLIYMLKSHISKISNEEESILDFFPKAFFDRMHEGKRFYDFEEDATTFLKEIIHFSWNRRGKSYRMNHLPALVERSVLASLSSFTAKRMAYEEMPWEVTKKIFNRAINDFSTRLRVVVSAENIPWANPKNWTAFLEKQLEGAPSSYNFPKTEKQVDRYLKIIEDVRSFSTSMWDKPDVFDALLFKKYGTAIANLDSKAFIHAGFVKFMEVGQPSSQSPSLPSRDIVKEETLVNSWQIALTNYLKSSGRNERFEYVFSSPEELAHFHESSIRFFEDEYPKASFKQILEMIQLQDAHPNPDIPLETQQKWNFRAVANFLLHSAFGSIPTLDWKHLTILSAEQSNEKRLQHLFGKKFREQMQKVLVSMVLSSEELDFLPLKSNDVTTALGSWGGSKWIQNMQSAIQEHERSEGLHKIWLESVIKQKAEPFFISIDVLGIEKTPENLYNLMNTETKRPKKSKTLDIEPLDLDVHAMG